MITCPEGAVPGDVLTVTTEGGEQLSVEVPEGAGPGSELQLPGLVVFSR